MVSCVVVGFVLDQKSSSSKEKAGIVSDFSVGTGNVQPNAPAITVFVLLGGGVVVWFVVDESLFVATTFV
jgi:hypothetical protein